MNARLLSDGTFSQWRSMGLRRQGFFPKIEGHAGAHSPNDKEQTLLSSTVFFLTTGTAPKGRKIKKLERRSLLTCVFAHGVSGGAKVFEHDTNMKQTQQMPGLQGPLLKLPAHVELY